MKTKTFESRLAIPLRSCCAFAEDADPLPATVSRLSRLLSAHGPSETPVEILPSWGRTSSSCGTFFPNGFLESPCRSHISSRRFCSPGFAPGLTKWRYRVRIMATDFFPMNGDPMLVAHVSGSASSLVGHPQRRAAIRSPVRGKTKPFYRSSESRPTPSGAQWRYQ